MKDDKMWRYRLCFLDNETDSLFYISEKVLLQSLPHLRKWCTSPNHATDKLHQSVSSSNLCLPTHTYSNIPMHLNLVLCCC
jgi:hypothetical protein